MPARRFRGGWVAGALVLGLSSPVVLPSAPASAFPVTALDDEVSVYRDSDRTVDVLINDEDGFGRPLTVCAVNVPRASQSKIYAYIEEGGGSVHLLTASDVSGSATFTYTTCAGDQDDVAEVTVQFKRLVVPDVRKHKTRKGRIRVFNNNEQPIRFRWGRGSSGRPDGRVDVRSGQTKVIRVRGSKVYWAALVEDGDGFANAGHGFVEGIKQ